MSEHVPVAQPPVRLTHRMPVDGLEGWRRTLPWWELYFAVATLGTILFTHRWEARAVLGLMALWYLAFGRRARRAGVPPWQRALYLAVMTALLVVAVSFAGAAAFILFALSPQAHMLFDFGWAVLATVVMNLIPTAVSFAKHQPILPALPIAFLAIVLTTMIGYSIDRLIQQSIALAASRAEVARLSREAERRRLGADLHDTIAQGLSSMLMLIQAADAALLRDADEAHRHLDLAARTARDNLREVRAVLDALMPTEQDLPEALRRLTTRFSEETGAAASLSISGSPRPLEIAAEVVLLRAAQESLSNVRRHAGARTVSLSLSYRPEAVQLEISDDGCGFEPSKIMEGYGLEAMRSRVTQAGGSVVVSPSPQGTTVRVAIPS